VGEKLVYLNTSNCRCRSHEKHVCRHSEVTGIKKTIGNKPLMIQRYTDQGRLNLAQLGAHHEKSGRQPEQKLDFVGFTFKAVQDREVFEEQFKLYQHLYTRKIDYYEREKREIRFKKPPGSPT
jgi:hypothetical protein